MAFSATAQSTSEQSILELSKNKFQWMVTKNYDSLERVLDERLQFVHSNGWTENKQEFIADIKSGKLLYNNITVTEAVVRVYSNSAVINGRGKFSVKLEGKDMEFDLKYTEVYIHRQGKWLLASRHANRMQ
jgi:hypothetical protein